MIQLPESRMGFGYCLLGALFILALAIGLFHVKAETSYQLDGIVATLRDLTAFWAGWAFAVKETPPTSTS